MPVEMSGRHYRGASATRDYATPWECPNCGAKNHGRVSAGCPTCQAGDPNKGTSRKGQEAAGAGEDLDARIARAVAAALKGTGVQHAAVVIAEPEPEPEGASALDAAPAPLAQLLREAAPAPLPTRPIDLPDIDTSDPRVRKTIARALIDFANTWDGTLEEQRPEPGLLSPEEAQALALQIAPELEGLAVEPTEDEQQAAEAAVAVGERHKAEILARLRAPNSPKE